MFAHFIINLFITHIGARAETLRFQGRDHLMAIIISFRGNRADNNLLGRQPKRHFTGIAFQHNADKTFQCAQHGAVQHHRTMLIAVFADISRIQPLGQHKVELQRAALPSPANRIAQMIFNFRAVKRPLARQFFPFQTRRGQGFAQAAFGAVPNIVLTGAHIGPQRQLYRYIFKTQIRIDLCHQPAKIDRLRNNLIFAAENMRVILRHLPHPHQPVQRAMRLIAMTAAKLGHAYRQVAIGFNALFKNLHMRRTIHRLNGH